MTLVPVIVIIAIEAEVGLEQALQSGIKGRGALILVAAFGDSILEVLLAHRVWWPPTIEYLDLGCYATQWIWHDLTTVRCWFPASVAPYTLGSTANIIFLFIRCSLSFLVAGDGLLMVSVFLVGWGGLSHCCASLSVGFDQSPTNWFKHLRPHCQVFL